MTRKSLKFLLILLVVFLFTLGLCATFGTIFNNTFLTKTNLAYQTLFCISSIIFIYIYSKIKKIQISTSIIVISCVILFSKQIVLNIISLSAILFFPVFFTKKINKLIFAILSPLLLFFIYIISSNLGEPEEYLAIVLIFLVIYSVIINYLIGLILLGNKKNNDKKLFLPFVIIAALLVILGIIIVNNYSNMLASGLTGDYQKQDRFICENKSVVIYNSTISKEEIITFLETLQKSNENPAILAELALLEKSDDYAKKYLSGLNQEINNKKFDNLPFTSEKWSQHEIAVRLYYLYLIRENFGELNKTLQTEIQNYYSKKIYSLLNEDLGSEYYKFFYKKDTRGFYQNQENGVGLIATYLLNYPDDIKYEELNNIFVKSARGWKDSWRNFDDSYGYQTIWIKNAYFMCLYNKSYCNYQNELDSIRFLSEIYNGNTSAVSFNSIKPVPFPNIFTLGYNLTEDLEFIYARDNMFSEIANNDSGSFEYFVGIELWKDYNQTMNISQKSCIIFSPAGIPSINEEIMPDKAVLRNVEGNYALINLRSSGWHRYKGTGQFYFLEENNSIKVVHFENATHLTYLPAGRSQNRDMKLRKEEFYDEADKDYTIYGAISNIFGLGSKYDQRTENFVRNLTIDLNNNSISFVIDNKKQSLTLQN